jgi:hypothetical protein
MVAYNFQRRFVAPIVAGDKTHTLRGPRRRHVRVGEAMQLYSGMRTKNCELIADALCNRFLGIFLKFSECREFALFDVTEQESGHFVRTGALRPIEDPETFARSDGFAGLEAMAAFWRDVHCVTSWNGFLVGWAPFNPPRSG